MSELNSCVKLPFPDDEIDEIVEKAQDWAITHGLCLRPRTLSQDKAEIAPFLLLPSTFPKDEFEKVLNVQTIINEIIHKIAYDHEFLCTSLSNTIKNDEYTRNLFKVYETVYKENKNFTKAYNLGILRSDYMLHNDTNKVKQIEINTIASSFGGLSTKISEWHRYILSILGYSDKLNNLLDNKAALQISGGLIDAWSYYKNPKSVILFVVEDYTVNFSDQRSIEFHLQIINPKVKVIRRSLTNLTQHAKLGPNNELIVDKYEVSVVYFRSGYDPSFYPTENEWEIRLTIERSNAIKCPSIQYQLAGTKKIQQMLSKASVLKKFTKNDEEMKKVQDLFVNLYALELDDAGNKAVQLALDDPENFVLKPQREGGGHNLYDEDMKKMLEKIKGTREQTKYILMDKIKPPPQKNYLIRSNSNDNNELKSVVSELGIYGVILGNQTHIAVNYPSGFLLRTKLQTSNEGGVAAGFGALDSPYLF